MSTTDTPRHARSFPLFPRRASRRRELPPVAGATDARVVVATWTPQDLAPAPQAMDELARMAKARRDADAWAGSRDTDRTV